MTDESKTTETTERKTATETTETTETTERKPDPTAAGSAPDPKIEPDPRLKDPQR